MRIHHLSCGTLCPRSRALFQKQKTFCCHCLLVETNSGLVLVDTGLGLKDVQDPDTRLGKPIQGLFRPQLAESETAVRQIETLGFSPGDVRHILLTHLDFDHAGGLADFPNAQVHVYAPEYFAALTPATVLENRRYRSAHWAHKPLWNTYTLEEGDTWMGFEKTQALKDLPPEILMIPLVGHTVGHCGIAIETPTGWVLHAGDAFYNIKEIESARAFKLAGLNLFNRITHTNWQKHTYNQGRLKVLHQTQPDIKILCSHDTSLL